LRIIAGRFKKRKLITFKGQNIRPTPDALREKIFNIIGYKIINANILDLFAGTGAMSLESISRGAKFAVIVDNSSYAISIIKTNIEKCNVLLQTRLIEWDVYKNLNCLKKYNFDLIFMDPPYQNSNIEKIFFNLFDSNCINKNSLLILEHSNDINLLNIDNFKIIDQRKYGKSFASFFKLNDSHSKVKKEE